MESKKTETGNEVIDLGSVGRTLWQKRRLYYIVMPLVFVLSCLWIFPQPRYYTCEVKLAPEEGGNSGGGLASVASSFGFDLDGMRKHDAIHPSLYPDLFESNKFVFSLLSISVTTEDKKVSSDYYTYLHDHYRQNPFSELIGSLFPDDGQEKRSLDELSDFIPDKKTDNILKHVKKNIVCTVDRKTDVITLSVTDQDRVVAATLADSIMVKLQDFIIDYRTKKVRQDVVYYQHLVDSARQEYEASIEAYATYADRHKDATLQSYLEYGEKLRNDLDVNLNLYNSLNSKLALSNAKVQERIPSFTTLRSASAPLKPAGPKRMSFVFVSNIIAFIFLTGYVLRKELMKFIFIQNRRR